MKSILSTVAALAMLVALLPVGVEAGQRIRVIDVDSSNAPMASAAINVPLTPAAAGTNTVTGLTATAATQTQVLKAGATQVTLTLSKVTLSDIDAGVTNWTASIVTNVTVNVVYGFADSTPQVVITNTLAAVAAVTNANAVSTDSYGFTASQANGILTNVNLLYKLLNTTY